MEAIKCNYCKLYKKHIKELELQERFRKKLDKINKAIEFEKDTDFETAERPDFLY